MRQEILDTKQLNFTRNLNIAMVKEYQELTKMQVIIQKDNEIIDLQEKIVDSAFSELQNGVITSTEYLTELNLLIQSRLKRALHELNLSHTYVDIYTNTGNNWNHNKSENE